MKKMGKAIEAILIVIGVIAPLWLLLFLISPEPTATVVLDIPNSNNQLVIKEEKGMRAGYIYFYLRRPGRRDKQIGSEGFNEPFCPIASGHYELIWEEGKVTVWYPFSSSAINEKENWREARLELLG